MSLFSDVPAPIPISSVKLDNNTTINYDVGNINTDSLTDGIAVLSAGYLKNLNDPITDDQAATKNYVDNFIGSANTGGPNNSIQINDGSNDFTGSNDLVFNKTTGLTTLNGTLTNEVITLVGDVLTGVAVPVDPQDAANKIYVDSKISLYTDASQEVTGEIGQNYDVPYTSLKETVFTIKFVA